MAETILRNLRHFGLTPWQIIVCFAIAYGWFTSLMPMPAKMEALTSTVQDLGTKVEIHSILIDQISKLGSEVAGMRRELSTIEGRLAHRPDYKVSNP